MPPVALDDAGQCVEDAVWLVGCARFTLMHILTYMYIYTYYMGHHSNCLYKMSHMIIIEIILKITCLPLCATWPPQW